MDDIDLIDFRDFFLDDVLLLFESFNELIFDDSRGLLGSVGLKGTEFPSINMTSSSTSRSPR